jgi:hypothetical protein
MTDIFQPASPDDIKNRESQRIQMLVDDLTSRPDCTKNHDGSYSFQNSVNLSAMHLTQLPIRFKHVARTFNCSHNSLTSLSGAPESVGHGFYCHNNQLKSLVGGPADVGSDFDCSYNKLTSLRGGPRSVQGAFCCAYNDLESLMGAPDHIGICFDCSHNALTTLDHAPQSVGYGDDGVPSLHVSVHVHTRGNFYCYYNPGKFTKEYVETICSVPGKIIYD